MHNTIESLLNDYHNGLIDREELQQQLIGIQQLPFAQVDIDRQRRTGQAECIFGQGKTPEHIISICQTLFDQQQPILVTRVDKDKATIICGALSFLTYDPMGRTLTCIPENTPIKSTNRLAVICAGTSDLPVAKECIATLTINGHIPTTITDIGVAGLHRLLNALPLIKKHDLIIVIAGMEGALPSVIAGLTSIPIIAVPTSVGYGAHQNGMTTLHAMLSSCASGLTVVNIDNGYGAACSAIRIMDTFLASIQS
ncbi:MAG: 1-(5-phosphoribosyl)-5-amino-4-imidazole-carboxylate carboxylase [Deltaproteobacteria bacterium]|nr:1-(5-phosphoribosyl)-5-amino-4-imidazole-carboxylate carboxylase [Deltaproteobacteria bacterium]